MKSLVGFVGQARWPMLAVAILFEVAAALSLKMLSHDKAWLALVVVGYAVSLGILALMVRADVSVGIIYGIWGASGIVLTTLFSAFLFDETVSTRMWFGVGLIVIGVAVVEIGGHFNRPLFRRVRL